MLIEFESVVTAAMIVVILRCLVFFFQAEDGIRDAQESRGLGDVYKRQLLKTKNQYLQVQLLQAQAIGSISFG